MEVFKISETSQLSNFHQKEGQTSENYLKFTISLAQELKNFVTIIARLQKKRIPDVLTGYIYHFFHHLNTESDGQIARYIEETLQACGGIGGCEYVCSAFVWRVYIGDRIIGIIKKTSDPDTFFSSFLACELRTDMNNKEFLADLLKNQTAVASREIITALTDYFHTH